MSKPKIGQGHAAAMFRLGLKELRNAANPSRDSVADSEIGLYGTQTQGEIAQARAGPGQGPEEEAPPEKMTLDELRESAKHQQANQKGQGKDRDMDHGRDIER